MHDTTFYEAWIGPFFVAVLVLSIFSTIILVGLWWQYRNRKGELDAPVGYTFKDHIKWHFGGLGGDVLTFLKWCVVAILVILAIGAAIVFIPIVWAVITSGFEAISVKGILIIIAVLLVLIVIKLK